MEIYPKLEKMVDENKLIKIVTEPILSSKSTSWRDTDASWTEERKTASINHAIVNYFKIDESQLDRFEVIMLEIISSDYSSLLKSTTYDELYLVLDKEPKIGYFLLHSDTYSDEYLSPKIIYARSDGNKKSEINFILKRKR